MNQPMSSSMAHEHRGERQVGVGRPRTLRALYDAEVAAELAKHPCSPRRTIVEADIAALPPPVRRFFHSSGFVGKPHTNNARLIWREMTLKRSQRARSMKLHCEQFASVAEPMRIALMTSKLAGLVPFEGRDKYQDGHGSMLIRLLKLVTVADARGRFMDESALVTVLSEALLTPSLALQPYVAWSPIDQEHAAARLTHGDLSVRGIFSFNARDELTRFDTEDRFQDGRPPRKLPWSAHFRDYGPHHGTRLPRKLSAVWHEPDGDFCYVEGTIRSIIYNVSR